MQTEGQMIFIWFDGGRRFPCWVRQINRAQNLHLGGVKCHMTPTPADFWLPFTFFSSSLPLKPVNVSEKNGADIPARANCHAWHLGWGAHWGIFVVLMKNVYLKTSTLRRKLTCLMALIWSKSSLTETAGMPAYYLRESNNVEVCFLSHSWAGNKPLAFVSTTPSRRMTSALKQ